MASEVSTAKNIGAAGAAVLGAALAAMPSPLLYEWINLDTNGLTAAGMVPIAAAIGGGNAPHLEEVGVGSNELGAEGARALMIRPRLAAVAVPGIALAAATAAVPATGEHAVNPFGGRPDHGCGDQSGGGTTLHMP